MTLHMRPYGLWSVHAFIPYLAITVGLYDRSQIPRRGANLFIKPNLIHLMLLQ